MSKTGEESPTSLSSFGRIHGVHRFRFNPRGTLNSSKSFSLDLTTFGARLNRAGCSIQV
jgi:hypothetical protein